MRAIRCPRCSQELAETLYEGVRVDQCHSCSGIWLDQGELGTILESKEKAFTAEFIHGALAGRSGGIPEVDRQASLPCPRCSGAMVPMNFGGTSGVIVDRCVEHGLWFDFGELEKIQVIHEFWQAQLGAGPRGAREAKAAPGFFRRVIGFLMKHR